jgi:hypothetical protein
VPALQCCRGLRARANEFAETDSSAVKLSDRGPGEDSCVGGGNVLSGASNLV